MQRSFRPRRLAKATYLLGLATLASLGGAARPAQAQNIVIDGSFEGATAAAPYQTYSPGVDIGDGWIAGAGGVDVINGYWNAEDGTKSIDLSGDANGSLSRDLPTVNGQTYNLSFYLAGNPDGAPVTKTVQVTAGSLTGTATFDTTGATHTDMGWTLETFTFKATSDTTLLTFTSADTDDGTGQPTNTPFGPALDNVSVTVAPEPSSVAVFAFIGLGAAALVLRARRRSSSAA